MWVAWGGRRGGWVCQGVLVLSHWALEGRDGVPGCPQHPKDCVTPQTVTVPCCSTGQRWHSSANKRLLIKGSHSFSKPSVFLHPWARFVVWVQLVPDRPHLPSRGQAVRTAVGKPPQRAPPAKLEPRRKVTA